MAALSAAGDKDSGVSAADAAPTTCAMCGKRLAAGEGHWCGASPELRRLGKLCDGCRDATEARNNNTDEGLVKMWQIIRGSCLLPGYMIAPAPPDLDAKRNELFRYISAWAKSRGMKAKCVDNHVNTLADWERICYKRLRKPKHYDKIYVARWQHDKTWCMDKTNQELCQKNPELLQCHWVAYHKDSYIRGNLFQSVDSCIKSFTHFMENMTTKAVQDCPICMESMLSNRNCSTCRQPVCQVCLSKVNKCPFCRATQLQYISK